MSLFLFSVIIVLILHQLSSLIQPKVSINQRERLRRRSAIRLPAQTYLALKAGIIATALVVFLVATIFIVSRNVHPPEGYAVRLIDAMTSPRIASAFFGAVVGLLIGNVVNRILYGGKKYELTTQDRMEVVLILILVILGIGGEEAIQSFARRITGIKIGTTNEISLSDATKASRTPSEQPSTASANAGEKSTDYLPTGGSSGLLALNRLHQTVLEDQNYIAVLSGSEPASSGGQTGSEAKKDADAAPDPFLKLTSTLSPVAGCMRETYSRTANARFLNNTLSDLNEIIYKLLSPVAPKPQKLAQDFASILNQVAVTAFQNGLEDALLAGSDGASNAFVSECIPLINLVCASQKPPLTIKTPMTSEWIESNRDAVHSCLDRPARSSEGKDIELEKAIELAKSPQIVAIITENNIKNWKTDNRPYLTTTYAGLLAQQNHYDSAALALHNWLQKALEKQKKNSAEFALKWSIIRARFALSIYLEEWVRSQGENAPLALRQYHIDNFAALVYEMRSIPKLSKLQKESSDYVLNIGLLTASHSGDDAVCAIAESDRKILGKAYESYLSALSYLIDNALKHPTYRQQHATVIEGYVRDLIKLSLKCLNSEVPKEPFRAEILDRYVRNQLNLIDNAAPLRSLDAIRSELRNAGEVLTLALQLLTRQRSEELGSKQNSPDFLRRIYSNDLIELYDNLILTKTKLQSREKELARE